VTPRIGVIGCGHWGAKHARTLASLGALAAVADRHPDRCGSVAAETGCPPRRVDELLQDDTLHGVVVALPPDGNAAMAQEVVRSGRHLLVEKPLALDLNAAGSLVRAADDAGVVAMTGRLMQFHPAFEALLSLAQRGQLGELESIRAIRIGRGRFFSRTDVLWDLAPHDLSMLLPLAAESPAEVWKEFPAGQGAQDALACERAGNTTFETEHSASAVRPYGADVARLHLAFASGLRAQCMVSRVSPNRIRRFVVIGSAAMAVFDDLAPWEEKLAVFHRVKTRGGVSAATDFGPPHIQEILPRPPLETELAHFLEAIRTGARPRSSVSEGLEVLRIIARAREREPIVHETVPAAARRAVSPRQGRQP
jgi:predicted dehydrogenase